jgi:hypothetical protein
MSNFESATTSSRQNFNSATAGQTNNFWVPEIFSQKVQVAFRKSAVCEAICNTDYFGDIASYGDTVNIIQEPQITVTDYTRETDTAAGRTGLTDAELILTVDQAKYFRFEVDDLENRFSHVNWQAIASDNAAYNLKDAYDTNVLAAIVAGSTTNVYGTSAAPIDTGFGSGEIDPLDVLARLARLLDDDNVPEENRYVVANPIFYEELAKTSSKLMSVDYNQGDGGLRNGLVASGKLRGFSLYKSNNLATVAGTASFSGTTLYNVMGGHMSAVAAASALSQTESFRAHDAFADVVRGMLVWGRKVLRETALAKAVITID